MKNTHLLLAAFIAIAAAGCSDGSDGDAGLDARSLGTGERDDRVGNDPAEQNTGAGSLREEEPRPQGSPQE
jgi:hypothetical protein